MFFSNEKFFTPAKMSKYLVSKSIEPLLPIQSIISSDDDSYVFSYYCNRKNYWGIKPTKVNIDNCFNKNSSSFFVVMNLSDYTTNRENITQINKAYSLEYLNNDYIVYSNNSASICNWFGSKDTSYYKLINAAYSNGINLVAYRIDTTIISHYYNIKLSLLWQIKGNNLSNETSLSIDTISSPKDSIVWIALPEMGLYKKFPISMNILSNKDPKSDDCFINQNIDFLCKIENKSILSGNIIVGLQDERSNDIRVTNNIPQVDRNYNYLTIPYFLPPPNSHSSLLKLELLINNILNKYVDNKLMKKSSFKEIYGGHYISTDNLISNSSIDHKIRFALRFSQEPGELWHVIREGYSSKENISPSLNNLLNEKKNYLINKGYLIPALITNNKNYPDKVNASLSINYSVKPVSGISKDVLFDGIYLDPVKQINWSGYSEKSTLEKNKWWNYSRDNSWPEGNIIDINIILDHKRFIDKLRLISGGNVGSDSYNYRLVMLYTSQDGVNYELVNAIPKPQVDSYIYYWNFIDINASAKYLKIRIIGDNDIFYLIPNFVRLSEIEVWSLNSPLEDAIDHFEDNSKKSILNKTILSYKYNQAIKKKEWFNAFEYNIKLYKKGYLDWDIFHDNNELIESQMDSLAKYYLEKATKYYIQKKYYTAFKSLIDGKKYAFNYDCDQFNSIIEKVKDNGIIRFGSILSNDTIPYVNYLNKNHPYSSVSPLLRDESPYNNINSNKISYKYSIVPDLWNNPLKGSELIDGSVYQTKYQVSWNIETSCYSFKSTYNGPEPSIDIVFDFKNKFILDEIRVISQLINKEYILDKVRLYISSDGNLYLPLNLPDNCEEEAAYGARNKIFYLKDIGMKSRYLKIKIIGKPQKRIIIGEVLVTGLKE
jgi:hypothetical protein